MRHLPIVDDIILPSVDASLVSADGTTAYAIVELNLPPEESQRYVQDAEAAVVPQPDLTVIVAGGPAFYADIETASQRDLRRAEVLALPVALMALLLVFGTVVSALVPLIVGCAGVAVVLLSLYWTAHVVDISIFALNLATMLGLGLAVDYSLFITSRFREELHRGDRDIQRAVILSAGKAGRAVFFSGMTVLIGLAGLSFFPLMFLRSIGLAGVVVVGVSTLAALTLLPAVLSVIGWNIERFPVRSRRSSEPSSESAGLWARLAHLVMKWPVVIALGVTAILVGLGSPFLHANISSPDATILPEDLPSRQGFDLLTEKYGGGEISPFVIVLYAPNGGMTDPGNLNLLDSLTRRVGADPAISRVQSASTLPGLGSGSSPSQRVGTRSVLERFGSDTQLDRFINDRVAVILAFPHEPANDPSNKSLLEDLRSMPDSGNTQVLVGGGTADIVDVVDDIYGDFAKVALLIVCATYLTLFSLFRSVLLPIKAILMNILSILAAYGALVWIFQDGHLHSWLRFTPQGFVEASLPVVTFCVLFGLSMDYEVFLLSRIQEEWLRSGDNSQAIAMGMQRSGRIISSAALIVVVVTASFVTADVVLVKALGLGIALAVALDATLVRAFLVPATMKLLGSANWWAPSWLARRIPPVEGLED
jgi:RND superfamily putative drug exporter